MEDMKIFSKKELEEMKKKVFGKNWFKKYEKVTEEERRRQLKIKWKGGEKNEERGKNN